MKKILSVILCAAMLAAVCCGCGRDTGNSAESKASAEISASEKPAAEPVVLRCGITVSSESLPAEALNHFNEKLQESTNGQIRIEVYYDGTLGNERDVIEGVSMGTIEMYAGSTAPLSNFVSDFNILDLPYVADINNLEKTYKVFDGEIGQKMLDSLSNVGIKGLAVTHQGFRCMLNSKNEVAVPTDAKNLVIRTMENDIHLEFYRTIGANPVAMSSTEAFTALAQGTIDGMDNILDAFYTQGAFESAKYLSLTGHILSGYIFAVNSDVFNSLSPELQSAFVEAGKAAGIYLRDRAMDKMSEIIDIAKKDYGVTVTEVDTSVWKEASASVAEAYKESIDTEYWNAFYN